MSVPTSIAGLQLWLDASDSSTITGTTTVTSWRDKSSNAYNLVPGSGTTSYANNAITVNSSYLYAYGAVDLSSFTFFIISKNNNTTNNQPVFLARPNTSPSYASTDGFSWYMDSGTQTRFFGCYPNGSQYITTSITTSIAKVYSVTGTSSGVFTQWNNGTLGNNATYTNRTNTAQGFIIGGEWTGSAVTVYSSCSDSVYEVLVYNSVLSTSDRQAIEGYLAWKWGLQTGLPSTHPYFKAPYLTTYISTPISIPQNVMLIPFNTYSTLKTFTLPVVSTNSGRMLIFKDMLGTSATNPVAVSTIGLDRIERNAVSSITLSQNFGAWTFMNDGLSKWFLTDVYQNTFPVQLRVFYKPGLWAKFYTNTGSIPDSNTAAGSGWGTPLTGTFTSGPTGTLGSNTPGPTNIIYYGNNDGYQPVSTYNYSAVYSGSMYSATGGTISFRIQTDDGFRLDYNGVNLINAWGQQGATDYYSSQVSMPVGYTPIVMRWYDTGGGGQSRMWYNINSTGENQDGTGVYFYLPSNITQT